MMIRPFAMSLAALFVLAVAAQGRAALVQTQIFSETFNTNTPDLATTTTTYPDFSGLGGNANIRVNNNQLEIQRGVNNYFLTNQSFAEEIWVTVDMGGFGSGSSNGQYATALVIGNIAFQFFPGCCNGALRTYQFNPATGAIGSNLTTPGDISMTFTPASSVMHHIELHSNGVGGLDLKFTNGSNPLQVYTSSYTVAGFVPGKVGFAALHGGNVSMFDNLTISALREEVFPAPEPTSVVLFSLGGLVLMSVSRSKRRQQAARQLVAQSGANDRV